MSATVLFEHPVSVGDYQVVRGFFPLNPSKAEQGGSGAVLMLMLQDQVSGLDSVRNISPREAKGMVVMARKQGIGFTIKRR